MRFIFTVFSLIFCFQLHAQDVLMQGWYWDYPKTASGNNWADSITQKANELGEAGITHLWLPPLSRASFGSNSNGYDPKDLYDLGEFGLGATGYGTRAELDASITALNNAGIKAVADVVYNHRDGGTAEQNTAVEGWIENFNCTKKNNGDNPFPSDRVRWVVPIGGATGNGATTYYFKVRSKSGHPDFHNYEYKFYSETSLVGYQNLPAQNESEPNGGGDCGQGNNAISLGIDYICTIDSDYNCGSGCGIDEFALTISSSDFNPAGDSIYIYMNNTGGYSDHDIIGIWNGSMDIQSQVIYQTYTDFTNMPSGQGGMNYLNFRPNGNPTQLAGDLDAMLFFYDYDQDVLSTKEELRDWTQWLDSDVGIEGLRMDAVKHFPSSFVSYLMDELQASGQSPDLAVGEFFDFNASALKGWTDAVNNGMGAAAQAEIDVKVFDFALRGDLKSACDQFGYDDRNVFNSGIVKGAAGNRDHVVTFINNHDFRHTDEPVINDPILPYAYILTNPEIGMPTVFYSDYYGVPNANAPTIPLETELKRLIELNNNYIQGATSVDYLSAFGSAFPIIYNSGFANTSLIYQTNFGGSGNDKGAIVAINFAGESLEAEITINSIGDITDGLEMSEVTGKSDISKTTISGGKMDIQVPPRSYAIYVSDELVDICNLDSILYVDLNATGLRNGSNWDNAFTNLASALNVQNGCSNVNEIWVKEGSYLPNTLNDRTMGFNIPANVTVIGGFQSLGNPSLGDQDINTYPTILSGDIGVTSDDSDNVHNVIVIESGLDSAYLEAIIIENGNANGAISQHQNGGGIYSIAPVVLKNIIIRNNKATNGGNGIYNTSPSAILTIDNVSLLNNTGSNSDVQNVNNASIIVRENSEIKE
ncbi:MAG: alpha-amylase family glycosyl hydrolase [Saprospiraceae bacterium]|nr:alpha-amylase family glycosyl hydrolase [Saprospiraceae bacterium]